MTKNQIIAKAMLVVLGIYAIIAFTTALIYELGALGNVWVLLNVFLILAIIFFIAYTLIFKNDFLACKICGAQDCAEDFDRRSYLVKTFRIAFVVLGLLFLCSSGTYNAILKLLPVISLPNIRMWISDVIVTKRITGNIDFSRKTVMNVSGLFRLIVTAYLLCGGKYIIGWHLKNSCLNPKTEELTDE